MFFLCTNLTTRNGFIFRTRLEFNIELPQVVFQADARGKLNAVNAQTFCGLHKFSHIINKNGLVGSEANFLKDMLKHGLIRLPMAHYMRRKAFRKMTQNLKFMTHIFKMEIVRI